MTWNRSGVSATRMRAQITLFGVTIAFVPADQDCRAERRVRVRLSNGLRVAGILGSGAAHYQPLYVYATPRLA
jgi:hypothetical protein